MLLGTKDASCIATLLSLLALASGEGGSSDILIRNITQILDQLLKDYDNSQHPNYREGRPTVVRTNMHIKSMGPFSELDMDYSMDCYFRQSWRDPRLSFHGPVDTLSLNIKMLEKLWKPDTYFHNGKNSYVHTITVPNKLLRISQTGDILYSMRNYPMDQQSCPLIFGSYAYTAQHLVYQWDSSTVGFVQGMTLSQFDLISSPHRNLTLQKKEGVYSILQVNFNLKRHAGYFLIQVYVPCVLIVILSWVSFWINREATSDRVGLGITAVLTLSTISLDSRTDLPKVHYATALDWFLLMSFGYCMATLLEFSGVHYFTKIGSGERLGMEDEEEWELGEGEEGGEEDWKGAGEVNCSLVYNVPASLEDGEFGWRYDTTPSRSMESKETQTERRMSCFKQFLRCVVADLEFRRQRMRAAMADSSTNSVSKIDRVARILFPLSFTLLNLFYWAMYYSFMSDECPRTKAKF